MSEFNHELDPKLMLEILVYPIICGKKNTKLLTQTNERTTTRILYKIKKS